MLTLALLIAAHFAADGPWAQRGYILRYKELALRKTKGTYALTRHAGIHALGTAIVLTVTGCPVLVPTMIIGVSHWCLDAVKIRWKPWGNYWDQVYHLIIILNVWSVML